MLGRLARSLRLLGADTLYRRDWRDAELTWVAHREGRLLLTRDARLVQGSGAPPHLLVRANHPFDQLVEVCRALRLTPGPACFTRCLSCNGRLLEVDPAEVADRLFPHVRETQRRLSRCDGCRRIYWEGTHLGRMEEKLARLRASLASTQS